MNKKPIIGYTTGVFDMFHVGHLRLLRRASENCDYLIVGVSSDELVQSYKNKKPVIPLEDRIEIVRGLRNVDKVVVQNSRDKYQAYKEIMFDVMFVGDDWKGDRLFQEAEAKLKEKGVSVTYFPYTHHISSSELSKVLRRIQREPPI